jgi:protoheme IX farnesyltransferase
LDSETPLKGAAAATLVHDPNVTRSDLRIRLGSYLELTKPRITSMVLVTAAAGFHLGSAGAFDFVLFAHTMFGVALVAAGTSALNQVIERDLDALMKRTRNRPIPAGRVGPLPAAVFSGVLAASGILYLAVFTNLLTAALAFATLASYDFMYTPLKRVHSFSTVVGAIPGALPALGGWTAATGALGAGGWALFAVLFVWQLPHFLTLSWILRDDYEAAGMRMLSVGDKNAFRTRHQTLIYTLVLLPVSLLPTMIGVAGAVYFWSALALGLVFLWMAVSFARAADAGMARMVFKYSVIYLPLVLLALAVDKQ